jgi:HK97 family phage prohead protease
LKTNLFAPFSKVEENDDGTVRVYGIASSESRDHDGELIRADAIRKALPDYLVFGNIREMHQPIAAGTAIEASVDDDGVTHLGALIVDPSSVKKVKAGVLKGFSLGGKVTKRSTKDKSIIEGIRLSEISLVDRPANPDALITLAKFDAAGRRKASGKPADDDIDEPLKKGLYDVGRLASLIQDLSYLQTNSTYEAASEQDGSGMPAKLKGACQALVECLRDMVDEETRELLGGMLDVASIKKALEDRGLLKSVDAKASLTIDGASVRDVVIEVVESLGLAKADNPGAATMDEKTLNDKIAKAVTDATEPLSKSVTDLTKSVDDLKTENATLAKSVATEKARADAAETRATVAEKMAQDIADQAVAKGIVKAVPKTEDGTKPNAAASDDLSKSKPTDVMVEMKAAFAKPLSPIRGL